MAGEWYVVQQSTGPWNDKMNKSVFVFAQGPTSAVSDALHKYPWATEIKEGSDSISLAVGRIIHEADYNCILTESPQPWDIYKDWNCTDVAMPPSLMILTDGEMDIIQDALAVAAKTFDKTSMGPKFAELLLKLKTIEPENPDDD